MSESLLLEQIERNRKEMVTLSNLYGLNSETTIQASKKLDTLLNLLNHHQINQTYAYREKGVKNR